MFSVALNRVFAYRIDDHWGVQALLLLTARVAVVPIGATLSDTEAVGEGLPWLDAVVAEARDAVHVGRHQEAVPVDRRVLVEIVPDPEDRLLALPQAQERAGDHPVDRPTIGGVATELDPKATDREIILHRFDDAIVRRLDHGP